MITNFLINEPEPAKATLLFAHGAGAPMDSPSMTAISQAIALQGVKVVRFEFTYMAARRTGGSKKPPPRADKLIPEYLSAIKDLACDGPLFIGGKSMGGRVASMIADQMFDAGGIAGVLCVGYPFHPPGKPEALRTAHLQDLRTPCLICQGTRDPFGTLDEVADYSLSSAIKLAWFQDGDHDLKPRKRISGFSQADHIQTLADTVSGWMT